MNPSKNPATFSERREGSAQGGNPVFSLLDEVIEITRLTCTKLRFVGREEREAGVIQISRLKNGWGLGERDLQEAERKTTDLLFEEYHGLFSHLAEAKVLILDEELKPKCEREVRLKLIRLKGGETFEGRFAIMPIVEFLRHVEKILQLRIDRAFPLGGQFSGIFLPIQLCPDGPPGLWPLKAEEIRSAIDMLGDLEREAKQLCYKIKLSGAPGKSDTNAFLPAKEYVGRGDFPDFKKLDRFLKAHPEIREKRPNNRRRLIHAGDMQKALEARRREARRALDGAAGEIQARLVDARAKKRPARPGSEGISRLANRIGDRE